VSVRSARLKRQGLPAALLAATFVVQGCAGGVSSRDAANYDGQLAAGNYAGAAAFAVNAGRVAPDGTSNNLLWSLDAGAAMTYAGDSAHTIQVFDQADEMIKRRQRGSSGDAGQYEAKTYDGAMVNAYKAIAAMHAGQSDLARTELFRSEDRQRRAEEEFQAELSKAQSREGGQKDFDLQSALKSAQADPAYTTAMKDMDRYAGYKPFINPFTTYLAGLYLLNTRDSNHDKALFDFRYVRGIVGPSPLLNSDIALAEKAGKFTPKTWVIFENGQGSTLVQYNITFPVPIFGHRSGVSVATVALPRLQENAPAAGGLLVGDRGERTTVVGNFDYVMRSEFKRRYPSILRNAVLEAALKVALQNVAAQEKSGLALIAATVVSNVSFADVRSWTALPKNFQAARIDTPKDGIVRLRTDAGADLGSAKVPTDVSSIVYVKEMRAGSPPSIQVLRF
jgi:uncharacterized protein